MHITFILNNKSQIKSTAEETRLTQNKENISMKMRKN